MATRERKASRKPGKARSGQPGEQLLDDASALDAAFASESDGELDSLEALDPRKLAPEQAAALARAATAAIEHVESKKDEGGAFSERITQRNLSIGKRFLEDSRTFTLDRGLRDRLARYVGRDPGPLRVHAGERAADAADALGARAFALGGTDLYFGRGQFDPSTPEGFGVLVHEVTHAVDNSVGAAFDTGSSQGDYSQAERRAEESQAAAEHGVRQGDAAGGEKAAEPAKIDLEKLGNALMKLVEMESRFMADRIGASANGG